LLQYNTNDVTAQYPIRGRNASEIAGSIEEGIMRARLRPGDRIPTVRELAVALRLSPTTVAAAYHNLRTRGLIVAHGRRGTAVSAQPPIVSRARVVIPAGVRDLITGSPDPALLPPLGPVLSHVNLRPRLYGEGTNIPALVEAAGREFAADGIPSAPIAVVSGALDGIERVLNAHLRPGDRVAVEDPGYAALLDLLKAMGLGAIPMRLDDLGVLPGELLSALEAGAQACVLTPRAQNPSGAAFAARRVAQLRRILGEHPRVLAIEDDHAGPIAGVRALTVMTADHPHWAIVRSVSKSLGPDLRLAVMTGDAMTIARVEGRQSLGAGWVSHILQQVVLNLWSDPKVAKLLDKASAAYTARRTAMVAALARHGIAAHGRSGLNVWAPVPEEQAVVQSMQAAGWGVIAGERYRIKSPPAIRITISRLGPGDAERIAADLARSLQPERRRSHLA
jgi:DNA-binding transcriptional MocR family regulator